MLAALQCAICCALNSPCFLLLPSLCSVGNPPLSSCLLKAYAFFKGRFKYHFFEETPDSHNCHQSLLAKIAHSTLNSLCVVVLTKPIQSLHISSTLQAEAGTASSSFPPTPSPLPFSAVHTFCAGLCFLGDNT